jgi:subtilisin family serine protease
MEPVMRKPLFILFVILFPGLFPPSISHAGVIHPALQTSLEALAENDEVSVIVTLSDQAEIGHIRDKHKGLRRMRIIRALKEKADLTQRPIIDHLAQRKTKRLTSLWLINGMAVTAEAGVIRELATLPGIESIRLDNVIPAPVPQYGLSAAPEWNLTMIHAPDLWGRGYTGQGVVVASMDSGVDGNHSDLQSKWRGGTNSWFDPYREHSKPYDAEGHGTMTMGVMVGGDSSGTAIGVAPGAKWIAVKIFDDEGFATDIAIHQGFQWLLDPDGNPETDDAPDVVNNSWGFTGATNECHTDFERDIERLKEAGIAVVFSAGNDGPGLRTSVSPGNNPGSFAVGAVTELKTIGWFSSQGPVPALCGGRIFPEVVAPGVGIRSSFPDESYETWDGTSFSAPHVAGAMALLLSAFPDLTVSELELSLKQTAEDLGASGPDNVFGYGLIDLLEAYYDLGGSAGIFKTFISAKAEDGWVRESSVGSGIGGSKGASGLILGDDSRGRQYRSILSFDTSGIPAGATITSATVKLKRRKQTGADPFLIMGPCYADVVTGAFGSADLVKEDFQAIATVSQAAVLSNPAADGAISTGVLNEEGMAAINRGGLTQIRLSCSPPTDGNRSKDFIKFYGGEDRHPENRPVLEVVYSP